MQWVDTADAAYAGCRANWTGYVSLELASDPARPDAPATAEQVATVAAVGRWAGVPAQACAFMDGAGHFRVFADLIMRLALPILVVVFFVSFQSTFNELPIAQVTLSDQQNTTAAVGLNSLVSNPLIQEWGLMAAGGVMMSIPLFTLFLLTQKSLVTGLTAGAVKG